MSDELTSLKCIGEILDGFSTEGTYTIKQYQDANRRINEILEKHNEMSEEIIKNEI